MNNKLKPLLNKPYFTSREAAKLGVTASLLGYYVRVGKLKRVRRGVYQKINFQGSVDFLWEDLIEIVFSIPKGVVCLLSALAIYRLTDEIPRKHWIAIPNSTSSKRTSYIRTVRLRNMRLGKTFVKIKDVTLPIFDKERCIVDSFKHLSLETALKALKAALRLPPSEGVDLIKLQDYAKQLRVDISPYLLAITTE